jgi:hypothetical protein
VVSNGLRLLILLGRRDRPTDALEDYSRCLRHALVDRGHDVELWRVGWAQRGWSLLILGTSPWLYRHRRFYRRLLNKRPRNAPAASREPIIR